jgi:2-keto-4-pentenoate hydratase/2-oxohepta-3-ene-1,7-dioic acid hydratase in catechol pathway
MKLVTFSVDGTMRAGAIADDGAVVDLHEADAQVPATMIELLAGGDATLERARAAAESGKARLAASSVTLEAPVPRPGKALAIGLNYRDHAAEGGQEIPKHPVVFSKVTTCIIGPGKAIERPRESTSVDWEGELCFVIGKPGRRIDAADALDHVAGYMNGNDVSVRDWQFHAPTWMMGKGFDTHGPTGPWLVTRDEIDASNLDIRTLVNGEEVQHSNTSQLIFDVPAIIEYLSTAFTLEPGDVVFTGTPAGVGVARKPPRFLKHGDIVRVEISGLGTLENPVVDGP